MTRIWMSKSWCALLMLDANRGSSKTFCYAYGTDCRPKMTGIDWTLNALQTRCHRTESGVFKIPIPRSYFQQMKLAFRKPRTITLSTKTYCVAQNSSRWVKISLQSCWCSKKSQAKHILLRGVQGHVVMECRFGYWSRKRFYGYGYRLSLIHHKSTRVTRLHYHWLPGLHRPCFLRRCRKVHLGTSGTRYSRMARISESSFLFHLHGLLPPGKLKEWLAWEKFMLPFRAQKGQQASLTSTYRAWRNGVTYVSAKRYHLTGWQRRSPAVREWKSELQKTVVYEVYGTLLKHFTILAVSKKTVA